MRESFDHSALPGVRYPPRFVEFPPPGSVLYGVVARLLPQVPDLWSLHGRHCLRQLIIINMIRKLKSGKYRIYSRHVDPKTHKRKNLGTFDTREAAEKHEREIQYIRRRS